MTIELFPLNSSAKVNHNTGEAELIELAIRRGEGQFAASRRAGRRDRRAHRPLGAGQVHRARCHHREGGLVGQQQGDDAGAVRAAVVGLPRARQVARAVRAGPVRRRRSGAAAERAHFRRVCLARAVHPPSAAPAAGQRAGRLQAAVHRRQPAELPGRPEALRRAHRDGDRLQLRQAPGADRRHAPMPARPRSRSSPISTTSCRRPA